MKLSLCVLKRALLCGALALGACANDKPKAAPLASAALLDDVPVDRGPDSAVVEPAREPAREPASPSAPPPPSEDRPMVAFNVTRAVSTVSHVDTSLPGYPSKGPPEVKTLSAQAYPGFDALMAKVLDETRVNGAVTLREYIALTLAGDDAAIARIDALGQQSHRQPSGASRYHTLELYDGERRIFRFPYNMQGLTGGWHTRLLQLVQDPQSQLFAVQSTASKLLNYIKIVDDARGVITAFDDAVARYPGVKQLCRGLSAAPVKVRFEVGAKIIELQRMPGAWPALDAAAGALSEAVAPTSRAINALSELCATPNPAAQEVSALLDQAQAARASFQRAVDALSASLEVSYRAHFGACASAKPGTFASGACAVMVQVYDMRLAYESGAALNDHKRTLDATIAALKPLAPSPAEQTFVEHATRLVDNLNGRAEHPEGYGFYRFYFHALIDDYVAIPAP